jgi:hypothetical protein
MKEHGSAFMETGVWDMVAITPVKYFKMSIII